MTTPTYNPYKALCLARDATDQQIEKAFRQTSYAYHPDRYPGDAAKEQHYKYLVNCRDDLKDPARRQSIDRKLRNVEATERQAAKNAERKERAVQAAKQRQAERAADRQELPSGLQRRDAHRGPRLGLTPNRRLPTRRIQTTSDTLASVANADTPSTPTSRPIRPIYRPPAVSEERRPPIERRNAQRQAPQRRPLLHAVPAELYEQQARLRNTVQDSWMPYDDCYTYIPAGSEGKTAPPKGNR
ncbi:hypothetical protein OHC33_009244 [Knufia fluminis]|uniref:J domain-containing protein n=1 Tax=Knufia fluminis TaxID=191047 RepID=A0AAN8EFP3_9EURO|nr:hypothetical protein OHC33_009244 [Knufia fluminis]